MGTGQLVMVDKGDSHSVFRLSGDSLVESLTDQIERGCDEDFPALGVSGVFPADGLAPHELVLGDLIRRFPLTALCPYLIGGLSDSELLTVNALHDTQMRVWERAAHCRRIPHSVPRGRDERVAARPPAGVGPTVEDVQPRAVHGHGLRPRLRRGRRRPPGWLRDVGGAAVLRPAQRLGPTRRRLHRSAVHRPLSSPAAGSCAGCPARFGSCPLRASFPTAS